MPEPTLIVLRCADLDRSRQFYEALGFRFEAEQHGGGPPHLSAVTKSGLVLELYPASDGHGVGRGTIGDIRLGFAVESSADVLTTLGASGFPVPQPSPAGAPVVVVDPDGRRVELTAG